MREIESRLMNKERERKWERERKNEWKFIIRK